MKETLQLILVLTFICVVAGLALAGVYDFTKDRIEEAKFKEMLTALERVLPSYDNDALKNKCVISKNGKEWIFYVARKDKEFAGASYEATSIKGYGGEIKIMVGINASDEIEAIEILSQTETPGLGAKIKDDNFRFQFNNKNALDTSWCRVKKDGGDINAVTGATISSRAVTEAVRHGLAVLIKNVDQVCKTGNQ